LISKGKTDSTYREELIESLLAKQLANVYELADGRVPVRPTKMAVECGGRIGVFRFLSLTPG
jgi:hypothetical protein